jgi:hypothetical protein
MRQSRRTLEVDFAIRTILAFAVILTATMLPTGFAVHGACMDADINQSGNIDIDDAIAYVNWLLAGGTSPAPCQDCLAFDTWYTVTDTSYERHDLEVVGDTLFSITRWWVTYDSIFVKSAQQIHRINVRGYHVADTFRLGLVEYDTASADTGGIGVGYGQ